MPSVPDNGDPEKAAFVLLEILERAEMQIRDGKVRPAAEVLNDLRQQCKST